MGRVDLSLEGPIAVVSISNPARLNAMSRDMWRALRAIFEAIHHNPDARCVILEGEGGNFCAGGDIAEYREFRFHEQTLREFHESDVWGALRAMLECDLPVLAQLEGACMGAGLEMACCCDIRIAGESARFGAPIAKLGFPMAPREAAVVMRAAGEATLREMLLEANVLHAAEMHARGFVGRVWPDGEVAGAARAAAARVARLAPQAARMNKRTLRMLGGAALDEAAGAVADFMANAYSYADSAEHREGISAFLEKRKPAF